MDTSLMFKRIQTNGNLLRTLNEQLIGEVKQQTPLAYHMDLNGLHLYRQPVGRHRAGRQEQWHTYQRTDPQPTTLQPKLAPTGLMLLHWR